MRKFEGRPAVIRRSSSCMPGARQSIQGVARQIGNMYALPIEIRFILLSRCWSGAHTNNELGKAVNRLIFRRVRIGQQRAEAVLAITNGGNTNNTSPIITISAAGDDIEAVHMACNVCSWTYTGVGASGQAVGD